MADRKGAGLSSGSSAAMHKANCVTDLRFFLFFLNVHLSHINYIG